MASSIDLRGRAAYLTRRASRAVIVRAAPIQAVFLVTTWPDADAVTVQAAAFGVVTTGFAALLWRRRDRVRRDRATMDVGRVEQVVAAELIGLTSIAQPTRIRGVAERGAQVVARAAAVVGQLTGTDHVVLTDILLVGRVAIAVEVAWLRDAAVWTRVLVAVVVLAIADFRRARVGGAVSIIAVAATFRDPVAIGVCHRTALTAFIDVAITVVVSTITGASATKLGCAWVIVGLCVIAVADERVLRAGAEPIAVEVEVFVDEAITVIVQAIAALHRAGEDAAIIIIAVIADVHAVEVSIDRAVTARGVRALDASVLDFITCGDRTRHAHRAITGVLWASDAVADLAGVIVRAEEAVLTARAVGKRVGVALIVGFVTDTLVAVIARADHRRRAHTGASLTRVIRGAELTVIAWRRIRRWRRVTLIVCFITNTLLTLTVRTRPRTARIADASLTGITLSAVGAIRAARPSGHRLQDAAVLRVITDAVVTRVTWTDPRWTRIADARLAGVSLGAERAIGAARAICDGLKLAAIL